MSSEVLYSKPVPKFRFAIVAVCWLTAIFLYFDRVNISMAAPHMMSELGLSGTRMGLILSMFSWGWIPGHLCGGIAADRLNIRRWGTCFFLLWCLATFLTGSCHTFLQFACVRLVFGFSEGAFINPMNKLQNHWVLPNERGLVNGSLMFAAYTGLVVGMPLVGWLIEQYGWRDMFFISALVSLSGAAAFWLVVYDYPKDHPWISPAERQAIEAALARDRVTYDSQRRTLEKLSFRAAATLLLRNRIFWAICGTAFFTQMIYVTNFSWLPSYLVLERGFSEVNSGRALSIPYLAAALGALSGGFISDRLGSRVLVIMLAVVLTIPPIVGLLVVGNGAAVLVMIGLVLFFNAAAVSLLVVLLFDLFVPEATGVALAIALGLCGGLGAAAGPIILGYAYDVTHSFTWGFVVMAIGMAVSMTLLGFVLVYERRIRNEKRAKALTA